mmetsp:Transcript_43124/g.82246  ORF Transcript_43124/g.82246 Transcript_43124/m.82246 type:complete len:145 (-) Transcript_43124:243-677(-)|eukprot:CAMPEP_0114231022 /NCGR_PEP_ID=MMETSP0058-20121206/3800_1 /TAXON_ID=36894 /ORGANISM="Pyramimonas parkeae, CCMP726" /LENGTH=144 /DNA_ID=CAMNT_0001342299 /DNA_START=222 /DNA_END=656 /DNA_ORIENTATION=-
MGVRAGPAPCGVCAGPPSKYKCPICRLPYCSVPCFKNHKETPCSKPDAVKTAPPAQPKRKFEEIDDEDDLGLRLSHAQLEALARHHHIRSCLRDDKLQRIIQEIDTAPDAERALDDAMAQSDFQEFCDKVLSVVRGSSATEKST